jgi:hypothetical protein
MTTLDALVRESPAMTLSIRATDDGIVAMIEAGPLDRARIGWGGGDTVEASVIAALMCAASDQKEAA